MYILSKRRDYWDGCAMSYGIDKARTIERKDVSITPKEGVSNYEISVSKERNPDLLDFERTAEVFRVIVNFYHTASFHYVILRYGSSKLIDHKSGSEVINYEDLVFSNAIDAERSFFTMRKVVFPTRKKSYRSYSFNSQDQPSGQFTSNSYMDKVLEEHEAPYCALSALRKELVINPILCDKAYRFDKISDAFSTYQLVDTALSELLTRLHEGKLVDIVEPDSIYKAGHDPKVSFRHRK